MVYTYVYLWYIMVYTYVYFWYIMIYTYVYFYFIMVYTYVYFWYIMVYTYVYFLTVYFVYSVLLEMFNVRLFKRNWSLYFKNYVQNSNVMEGWGVQYIRPGQ